jgi:hypothetical protein
MNEPNRVYTIQDPPAWIPEEQSVHQPIREALYLRELARMEFTAVRQPDAHPVELGLRLGANPVRLGSRVVALCSRPARVGIWNSNGALVAICEQQGRTATWDTREAAAGCYWLRPLDRGTGVKLVVTR